MIVEIPWGGRIKPLHARNCHASFELGGTGVAAGAALAAAALGTPELAAAGRAAFLLAATVLGFLAGSALPPAAVRVAHPLVVCAAAANLGAAALGALTGAGYLATLRTFLTKVPLVLNHLDHDVT